MSREERLRALVLERLREVVDPELGLNIVEAGFVRDVKIEGGKVRVDLMLTSPFCPLAFFIIGRIREVVRQIEGVEEVDVNIVGFGVPPELQRKLNELSGGGAEVDKNP